MTHAISVKYSTKKSNISASKVSFKNFFELFHQYQLKRNTFLHDIKKNKYQYLSTAFNKTNTVQQ